ncbi:hypothetical protein HYDPIDRAFT_33988 [Hydnomerulius pinastri MD-312]|uniref:Uncharacterized protein n=1 Tax=Hydnomerulius pinastri MD-312 TaxID=994086 RepID=A0A0C9VZ14_9AGAM|nr:hypothetical protein HYDPIDRAFT_33988 [Hydnomerulius pinastri MD-312]
MSRVQLEFDDHEKDIVRIIGQEDYNLLYLRFVNEIGRRLGGYNNSTGTVSAKLGPDMHCNITIAMDNWQQNPDGHGADRQVWAFVPYMSRSRLMQIAS